MTDNNNGKNLGRRIKQPRLMVNKGKQQLIKTIIRCPDDMVMVFDEKGEQIPEYQNRYERVKESILKSAPPNAVFWYTSNSEPQLREIPKEEW